MDVRMPEMDGIEATRRIVALDGSPMRVLLLSTFDLEEYLLEALDAGRQRDHAQGHAARRARRPASSPSRATTRWSRPRSPSG